MRLSREPWGNGRRERGGKESERKSDLRIKTNLGKRMELLWEWREVRMTRRRKREREITPKIKEWREKEREK